MSKDGHVFKKIDRIALIFLSSNVRKDSLTISNNFCFSCAALLRHVRNARTRLDLPTQSILQY
jgi:hypothetical protein